MNYIVVLMAQPSSLGEFEQVVLLAILRRGDNAYGVTIRSEIAACTGRAAAPGARYTTLDRMEEKRIVRSWLRDATPQRGGRAKRYFALTKPGRPAERAAGLSEPARRARLSRSCPCVTSRSPNGLFPGSPARNVPLPSSAICVNSQRKKDACGSGFRSRGAARSRLSRPSAYILRRSAHHFG